MSECICGAGFGMNLSCPEHSPFRASGAAGPPSDEAPASGRDWYDEVLRLRAALASAEQRARTLETSLRWAMLAHNVGKPRRIKGQNDDYCDSYDAAIRALGASPEGRGSATP
jgi:hypothetical protein